MRFSDRDLAAYTARTGKAPHAPPQPTPARGGGQRAGSSAEEALWASLHVLGIPHTPQHPWGRDLTPPRRFHSDAAIPERRLLVEIDGQVHSIRDKRERDLERQNLGTLAGWVFLRFTPAQALDGSAALIVQRWLEGER